MRRLFASLLAAAACSGGDGSGGAGGLGGGAGAGGAGGTGGAGGAGGSPTGGAAGAGGAAGSGGAAAACGDGQLDPGEPCDGGPTCSATCEVLPSDACPGSPAAVGVVEVVLAGDTTGFSDDAAGRCAGPDDGADVVYALTTTVGGTLALFLDTGAALRLYVRRACADGSPPGQLACDEGFGAKALVWAQPGETFWVFVDGMDGTAAAKGAYALHARVHPCGDGAAELLEECDDPADPDCVGCLSCASTGQLWDTDAAPRRCYTLLQGTPLAGDWDAARAACAPHGELASTPSTLVRDRTSAAAPALTLTGATDMRVDDDFRWMDGSPLWFAPWYPGQPSGNEDCVSLYEFGEHFVHDCGDDRWAVLCERAPIGGCGDGVAQGVEACDDGNHAAGDGCGPDCAVECAADPSETEEPSTHRCYRLVTSPATWTAAAEDCKQWGGWLADVTSEVEQQWLDDLVGAGAAWLGVTGPNPFDFVWAGSGEDDVYRNWTGGLAIGDCGFLQADGEWNRADCDVTTKAYVCERKPAGTP